MGDRRDGVKLKTKQMVLGGGEGDMGVKRDTEEMDGVCRRQTSLC